MAKINKWSAADTPIPNWVTFAGFSFQLVDATYPCGTMAFFNDWLTCHCYRKIIAKPIDSLAFIALNMANTKTAFSIDNTGNIGCINDAKVHHFTLSLSAFSRIAISIIAAFDTPFFFAIFDNSSLARSVNRIEVGFARAGLSMLM